MFTETEYERRILAKFAALEADNKRLKQQALAGLMPFVLWRLF
jgi:hypothetical protein